MRNCETLNTFTNIKKTNILNMGKNYLNNKYTSKVVIFFLLSRQNKSSNIILYIYIFFW